MLPDVQFGLRWPDEDAGEEDRSLWAEKEARAFAAPRQSKAKAKGKARPKLGGVVVKSRLTAHSVLRSLDRLLKAVYDGGLELFMQRDGSLVRQKATATDSYQQRRTSNTNANQIFATSYAHECTQGIQHRDPGHAPKPRHECLGPPMAM